MELRLQKVRSAAQTYASSTPTPAPKNDKKREEAAHRSRRRRPSSRLL